VKLDPRRRRLVLIAGGGVLLAALFMLGRGRAPAGDAAAAPTVDPATMPTFAAPAGDGGGGSDLTEVYSTLGQLQAGQQQLADAIVGGQQQLSGQLGALQLGGAAAPVEPPPATTASPVARSGAHNTTAAATTPTRRAPSQIHLRVADARATRTARRGTTNRTIADLARAHPDWGPHTLAAGHQLRGHSVRF
jgi:hypothetical protein